MEIRRQQLTVIKFLICFALAITLFWPFFSKAQGEYINLLTADSNCVGSTAIVNLAWNSNIGGTYYVDRKISGGTFSQIGFTTNLSFTDTDNALNVDKDYVYRIRAGSISSNEMTAPAPYCPPIINNISKDCLFDTTPGGPVINLSWSSLTGVEYYEIYRKAPGGTFSLLASSLTGINYQDKLVESLSTYGQGGQVSYFIKAFWPGGVNSGSDQNQKQIEITPCPPFLTVDGHCSEDIPSNPEMHLSWTVTAGATNYNIYRGGVFFCQTGTSCRDKANNLIPANASSFIDYSPCASGEYSCSRIYRVETGMTLPSNSVDKSINCVEDASPLTPPDLNQPQPYCVGNDSRIGLSWTPSENAVYYTINRNGENIINIVGTTYTDSGVQSGIEYTYYVVAHGPGGRESPSSNVRVVTAVDCTPPSKPTLNLTADCAAGNPYINLSWTTTTNTESYEVYRGLSASNLLPLITFDQNSPYFTSRNWDNKWPDVLTSTTYYYKIVAHGPEGVPSTSSDVQATTTTACLPTTPILSFSDGCTAPGGSVYITLTWTTDHKNTDHYEIFREDSAINPIRIETPPTTTWADYSVVYERQYNYRIEAVSPTGQKTRDPASGYKSRTTRYCNYPDAFTINEPTNIVCQGSYPKADLSWAQSLHAGYYRLRTYRSSSDYYTSSQIFAQSVTDRGLGYALKFDGSNDYVVVPDSDVLDNIMTFETWFNSDRWVETNSRDPTIFQKYIDYNNYFRVAFDHTQSGMIAVRAVRGGIDIGRWGRSTTGVPSLNTWHHLVVVFSSPSIKIYLDGLDVTSASVVDSWSIYSGSNDVYIGSRGDAGYFSGSVDEVRFYNRALTLTEIAEHYNGTFTNEPGIDGLIGLFHFDEGSGQIASNSSNYGIDGYSNNGIRGSNSNPSGDSADPQWFSNGLQSGLSYYWRTRAYSSFDQYYLWSTNTTATYLMPNCPPTQPGLVLRTFCEPSTHTPAVALEFSYSIGASNYKVYRDGTEIGTISQSVSPPVRTFTDNNEGVGLIQNTAYTYWVKAVGSGGETESDHLAITTPRCVAPTKPPIQPAVFSCDGSHPRVRITWGDSDNTTSYRIYRDDDGDGDDDWYSDLIGDTDSPTYSYDNTYPSVQVNTTYTYWVIASGPDGSATSDLVTITTGYCIPAQPSLDFVTTDCQTPNPVNTIYWSDPDAEARQILNDGFESGDFSRWTDTNVWNGTLSVVTEAKHQGVYSAKAVKNAGVSGQQYSSKNFTAQPTVFLRAYFRFADPHSSYAELMSTWGADWNWLTYVALVGSPSSSVWRLYYHNGASELSVNSSPFVLDPNKWYSVELKTVVHGSEGEARLYIDGVEVAGVTNIDSDEHGNIIVVAAGLFWSGDSKAMTWYYDDVIVSDVRTGPGSPIYNADKYEIYRNTTDNSSTATLIKTITTSDPEFLDRAWKDMSGLNNKQQYYYWVKSIGPAGASIISSVKSVTTYYCGIPPTPTLSLVEEPFCKNNLPYATLSWTTSSDATSYNLSRIPPSPVSTYSTRVTPFTDKGSFALQFDGVNDYGIVEKNDDSLNKFDAGLTIEVWGKQTSYIGGNDSWLLDKDYTGYRIWGDNSFNFGVRTPTQEWRWVWNGTPNLDQWYHVVGVLDNINQKMYLYVDGNLRDTTDLPEKYNFDYSNIPLTFGSHSNWYPKWPGVIDEVRIYGRALSATEVNEHKQGIYKNEAELRGAWHFDEGEGITIFDSSGKGNNGRIAGPEWVDGKVASALEFGGMDDGYVEVPDSLILKDLSVFTVEAWFFNNPPSTTTWPLFIGKGAWGAGGWVIDLGGSSQPRARMYFGSNTDWSGSFLNVPIPTGEWTHLVYVVDRSANKAYSYKNGLPIGSVNSLPTYYSSTRPLIIGQNETKGIIDEVRIYNRALSLPEIQKHYNNEFNNGTDLDGLVGLWHLNEEGGTTAYDSSPFANNGTLIKGPDWIKPEDAPASVYTTALVAGDSYKYSARAVGVKVTSNSSNEISFAAPSCLPAKPDLQVKPQCDGSDSQLKLEWLPDSNTIYWSIYKGRESEAPIFLVDTILTSYTDSNIQNGINYTYYLVARGKDVDTFSAAITKTAPDYCLNAPTKPSLRSPDGSVSEQCLGSSSKMLLDWDQDLSGNTLSFNILRCLPSSPSPCASDTDFSAVRSNLASSVTEYLDSVTEGEAYVYEVEAVGAGVSVRSLPSAEVTGFPCSTAPPNPPTLSITVIESTGDNVAVHLLWQDVGNADYYKIFRSSSPPENVTVDSVNPSLPCPDANAKINAPTNEADKFKTMTSTDFGWQNGASVRCGLIDGQTYTYQVIAYNNNGQTASNPETKPIPPAPPGNFQISGTRQAGKVLVEWKIPGTENWNEATPTPSGGQVTYKLLRSSTQDFSSSTTICQNKVGSNPYNGSAQISCEDLLPTNLERFYKAVAKNTNNTLTTDSNIVEVNMTLPTWKEIPPF